MKRPLKTVLAIFMIFHGCINSQTPAPSFYIRLYYKSQSGNDLLNPTTQGHYNKDAIQVTDLITKNGIQSEIPTPIDSCSSYVCQSPKTNWYYIQFSPNRAYNGTLIHLGSQVDSLNYVTMPMNSGYGVSKVMYKNQVIWSSSTKFSNFISLTIAK